MHRLTSGPSKPQQTSAREVVAETPVTAPSKPLEPVLVSDRTLGVIGAEASRSVEKGVQGGTLNSMLTLRSDPSKKKKSSKRVLSDLDGPKLASAEERHRLGQSVKTSLDQGKLGRARGKAAEIGSLTNTLMNSELVQGPKRDLVANAPKAPKLGKVGAELDGTREVQAKLGVDGLATSDSSLKGGGRVDGGVDVGLDGVHGNLKGDVGIEATNKTQIGEQGLLSADLESGTGVKGRGEVDGGVNLGPDGLKGHLAGDLGATVAHQTRAKAELGDGLARVDANLKAKGGLVAQGRADAVADERGVRADAQGRIGAEAEVHGEIAANALGDTVKAKGQLDGRVAADAQGDANARLDWTGLHANAEGGLSARAEVEAHGDVDTPVVKAEGQVKAKAEAFAQGDVQGNVALDDGVGATAHGVIGARAKVEAEGYFETKSPVTFANGNKVALSGEGRVEASVAAMAEGTASVGLNGVKLKGDAWVGAEAAATGEIGIGVQGRRFVAVGGNIRGRVGYGATGGLTLGNTGKPGEIGIGGDIGAAFKGGAAGGVNVKVNVKEIADAAVSEGVDLAERGVRLAEVAITDPRQLPREAVRTVVDKAKKVTADVVSLKDGLKEGVQQLPKMLGQVAELPGKMKELEAQNQDVMNDPIGSLKKAIKVT